jgi:hypothetical protein
MRDEKECIICFIDTSANDYLELDCCKQTVHIECLNTWIKTNIKNTEEVRKCFHCKRNNDYINTIIYYTRLEEGNTSYDSDSNSLIEVHDDNSIIHIRQPRCCMLLFNLICFAAIISIASCILLSEHNENNGHKKRTLLSIPIYYIKYIN